MSEKKYIDADKLSNLISETRLNLPHDSKDFFTRDEMLLNFEQYVNLIEPAADVVEVVRCKDCRLATEDIMIDGWYYCYNDCIPLEIH